MYQLDQKNTINVRIDRRYTIRDIAAVLLKQLYSNIDEDSCHFIPIYMERDFKSSYLKIINTFKIGLIKYGVASSQDWVKERPHRLKAVSLLEEELVALWGKKKQTRPAVTPVQPKKLARPVKPRYVE